MTEYKTAVVNLGTGMIYKIVVADPEQPQNVVISRIDADGEEYTAAVSLPGEGV